MAKRIKDPIEVEQNYAHLVLKDAESVLMRRISRMREGKPRTGAQKKLAQIRKAFLTLKSIDTMDLLIIQ